MDLRPMHERILWVTVLATVLSVYVAAAEPKVASRLRLPGSRLYGVSSDGEGMFYVLLDSTLLAYSHTGDELWRAPAPWCARQGGKDEGEIGAVSRPPPVPLEGGLVAVVNCVEWKLSLQTYDKNGRKARSVQVVTYSMAEQDGSLHLVSIHGTLVFGYRLGGADNEDRPDKGVVAYDLSLRPLWSLPLWGNRLVGGTGSSVYAPRERWGKNLKWTSVNVKGQTIDLPESVSERTCVIQPGLDGELILWGGEADSTGTRPDGNLDSKGVRRVWAPGEEEATTIHTYWRSWQGAVVPCPGRRYVLRIWPGSKQQFICLDRQGKTLWRYQLKVACYFWPPGPLCDSEGNIYLMDTIRGPRPDGAQIVLIRFSPGGKQEWQLAVDSASAQPVFRSSLCGKKSVLLVREYCRENIRQAGEGFRLVFVRMGD